MRIQSKRKGEIAVFLTLLLAVLSSFVTALAANVQKYVCRTEAAYAVDSAIRSCFAEYDREVFEEDGVLLIDSSYNSEEGGIDRIREHFLMYLACSLTSSEIVEADVSGSSAQFGMEDESGRYYGRLTFTAKLRSPSAGEYSITREYAYDTADM